MIPPPDQIGVAGGSLEARLAHAPVRRGYLLGAAAVLIIVYLAGVTGRWWPTPDSATYLGLGRSLAEGEGYRFNGQTHTTFPPGLPGILAVLHRTFGEGYWAPNLFMALCGLGALVAAYRAMRRLASPEVALAVVLATGLCFPYYSASHRILSEAPFTLAFWVLVCAATSAARGGRAGLVAAAILAPVCVALRLPGALLVGSLALGIVLDRSLHDPAAPRRVRRRLLVAGVIVGAIASAGAAFVLAVTIATGEAPGYATLIAPILGVGPRRTLARLAHSAAALPGALAEIFTSQDGLRPVGAAAGVLIVVGMVRLWWGGRRLAPTVLLLYPLGLALCLGPFGIRPRYFVPMLPLIFHAALTGGWTCLALAARLRRRPLAPRGAVIATVALVALVLASNAPRIARSAFYYSALSWSPDYYQKFRRGRYAPLFVAADLARLRCPPGGMTAADRETVAELHYLTRRRIRPLPSAGRQTERDAERLLRAATRTPPADLILLDTKGWNEPFRARVTGALLADRSLTALPATGRFLLFRRVVETP